MAGEHFWQYLMKGISETGPRLLSALAEEKIRAKRPLTEAEKELLELRKKEAEMREFAQFGAPYEDVRRGYELYQQPPLLGREDVTELGIMLAKPRVGFGVLKKHPGMERIRTPEEEQALRAYRRFIGEENKQTPQSKQQYSPTIPLKYRALMTSYKEILKQINNLKAIGEKVPPDLLAERKRIREMLNEYIGPEVEAENNEIFPGFSVSE